jgi:hypothetical protein
MTGDCEPHMGWSHGDIMKGANKAKNDHLGAQYFMLRGMILKFCQRMKTSKINFRMYMLDARYLPTRLASWKENVGLFDRIEVSAQTDFVLQKHSNILQMTNACDGIYIGPAAATSAYTPLLKSVALNPNAVLLLLFQNAVPEMDLKYCILGPSSEERSYLMQCMSEHQYPRYPNPRGEYEQRWHPNILRYQGGLEMLRDMETPFEQFAKKVVRRNMLINAGLRPREPYEHSIISAWLNRMTPGGTKAEFEVKLAKCYAGWARYVECVKMV